MDTILPASEVIGTCRFVSNCVFAPGPRRVARGAFWVRIVSGRRVSFATHVYRVGNRKHKSLRYCGEPLAAARGCIEPSLRAFGVIRPSGTSPMCIRAAAGCGGAAESAAGTVGVAGQPMRTLPNRRIISIATNARLLQWGLAPCPDAALFAAREPQ